MVHIHASQGPANVRRAHDGYTRSILLQILTISSIRSGSRGPILSSGREGFARAAGWRLDGQNYGGDLFVKTGLEIF